MTKNLIGILEDIRNTIPSTEDIEDIIAGCYSFPTIRNKEWVVATTSDVVSFNQEVSEPLENFFDSFFESMVDDGCAYNKVIKNMKSLKCVLDKINKKYTETLQKVEKTHNK